MSTKVVHWILRGGVLLGLLLGPMPIHAKTDFATTTVSTVYVNSSGDVLVQLASGQSGESCTSDSWARIDTTQPRWEQMFDVALSAKLSGKPVSVRISGCSYYPLISSLFIK